MSVDVAIVGAGSAGAAAAWACASQGLRVVVLERGALGEAGSWWLNGVPTWAFHEAGLPPPTAPIAHGDDSDAFHMIAGWGPESVVIRAHGVREIHMGHLVADLQARAVAAGAELREGVTVTGRTTRGLRTSEGAIEATWVVDCGGLAGPNLLGHAPVPRSQLCTAAQQCHALADESGARAWYTEHGVPWGDRLCFTGLSSGFSILNVRVHDGEVAILTGAHATGPVSGGRLLDDFVASQSWVGTKIAGGRRAIPIGPPRLPLARGTVAALGDSAGQVFAAHGSGIGQQLVAARMLGEALAAGEGVRGYARRWRARFEATLRGSAAFAELSRRIASDDLALLVRAGAVPSGLLKAGLGQRPRLPRPGELARMMRGLSREPETASRLGRAVAAMALGGR